MTDTDRDGEQNRDEAANRSALTLLAIVGWIVPLLLLAFGHLNWWQLVLWLIAGTLALVWFSSRHMD